MINTNPSLANGVGGGEQQCGHDLMMEEQWACLSSKLTATITFQTPSMATT